MRDAGLSLVQGQKGPEIVRGDVTTLLRQADRYLGASKQDSDPAYGLTHASYARVIYEGLAAWGINVKGKLAEAGEEQDRWGTLIQKMKGRR